MTTHVKVLGVLYIAVSLIGIMFAVFMSLIFGTASGIVGVNADPQDAAIALPIIGLTGTMLVVFLLTLSLPGLVTGIGLLKLRPWARIVGIVLAVLNFINIPFGLILGIYGLWVLLSRDTEQLFSGRSLPSV